MIAGSEGSAGWVLPFSQFRSVATEMLRPAATASCVRPRDSRQRRTCCPRVSGSESKA